MTTHTYVAVSSPSLTLYFDIDEDRPKEKVQFTSANYITDDDDIAAAIDRACKKKVNLSRMIRKLDKDAAEKVALAHKEKMRNPLAAGASGGMNSENANLLNRVRMDERDAALNAIDPTAKQEILPDKDIMFTEAGTGAGTPPETAAETAKVEKAPTQKINLGGANKQ